MTQHSLKKSPPLSKEWTVKNMMSQEVGAGSNTPRPLRVLIVDDDPFMQVMVAGYLEKNNIRAIQLSRRQDLVRYVADGSVDLILLDLRCGQNKGLDLLREIRTKSDVPLIITAGGDCVVDRVVGLELGADHYLAKPFSLRELLASIRAVLRRCEITRVTREEEREQFRFGSWQFDPRHRLLTNHEGYPVPLTKGEYALLAAFVQYPQRPLSREYLLHATRIHEDIFDRSIDVQILRLRRKLETDPAAPRIIKTERGIGYVFALAVERFPGPIKIRALSHELWLGDFGLVE